MSSAQLPGTERTTLEATPIPHEQFAYFLQRANLKPKRPNFHWAGAPHRPSESGISTEPRSATSTQPDTAMDSPTACPCPCRCCPLRSESPSGDATLSSDPQPSTAGTRKRGFCLRHAPALGRGWSCRLPRHSMQRRRCCTCESRTPAPVPRYDRCCIQQQLLVRRSFRRTLAACLAQELWLHYFAHA